MSKIKIKIFGGSENKFQTIKLVKEYGDLGLIESKDLCDIAWLKNQPIEINIDDNILETVKQELSSFGLIVKINDRERKMKRILYSEQSNLINDMLSDVSIWNTLDIITEKDKENLTYNQCREKAISIIFDRYSKSFKADIFMQLYNDISNINKLDIKFSTELKFIKFNEEFGEMCAEYLKFKGLTYKEFHKEELLCEMADTLQVLLSIFSDIEKDTDIFLSDVIDKIKEKNIKWKTKIEDYLINK